MDEIILSDLSVVNIEKEFSENLDFNSVVDTIGVDSGGQPGHAPPIIRMGAKPLFCPPIIRREFFNFLY